MDSSRDESYFIGASAEKTQVNYLIELNLNRFSERELIFRIRNLNRFVRARNLNKAGRKISTN